MPPAPSHAPLHPHLKQVRQLQLENLGLLSELADGVLVLLDVPLGALIEGLPVTLWGQVRWADTSSVSLGRWMALPRGKTFLQSIFDLLL